MNSGPSVSVIVCTCNRAAALQRTLGALGKAHIPSGWKVEVIVVDNASTDETAKTVRMAGLRNTTLQYLYEPKRGLSNARNAALAEARGEIILFTDDDVLVAEDWIEQLASPLANGRCEAVGGQIIVASDFLRPWMEPMHKNWLGLNHDAQLHEATRSLIGASMGFRRSVLERVPRFDADLGAGALGSAEDTLFGWQLAEAGFRIEYAPQARVIHDFDVSRLQRNNWLSDARKRGRAKAYLYHHWEHTDIRAPGREWFSYWARLQLRRVLQPPPALASEGCPAWEMSYILNMEKCKRFCLERQRPRNYSRRGLAKRA